MEEEFHHEELREWVSTGRPSNKGFLTHHVSSLKALVDLGAQLIQERPNDTEV